MLGTPKSDCVEILLATIPGKKIVGKKIAKPGSCIFLPQIFLPALRR
jgi:hypothetical protein